MSKQKKVITFLNRFDFYPNLVAVLENYALMLEENYELKLITGDKDEIPQSISKYYQVFQYSEKKKSAGQWRYMYNALKDFFENEHTDILTNTTSPLFSGYMITLFGKKKSVKTILRLTGDLFAEKDLETKWRKRFYKQFIYEPMHLRVFKAADELIPIGQKLEADLLARGIQPTKMKTMCQPFKASSFPPISLEEKLLIKEKLGILPNKKTILFAGRLVMIKGIDVLHEIIDKVSAQSDQFQFCITGTGPLFDSFDKYPLDLVAMQGYIEHDDLHQYYQCADLFLYPTKKDAMPTVLLEALSARLPIAATKVGEIPMLTNQFFSSSDEFTEYILEGNYQLDPIPDWFAWDFQKKKYNQIFNDLLNS